MAFYTGVGQEVRRVHSSVSVLIDIHDLVTLQQGMAQQILTQFQDHPESWTRVPDILEKAGFPQTKVCLMSLCAGDIN